MKVINSFYETDKNIYHIEVSGTFSFQEIYTNFKKKLDSNEIPSNCHKFVILDCDIEKIDGILDYDWLNKLYNEYDSFFSKARFAICTDKLEIHALTISLRKRFKTPINRPFASKVDAYKWLSTPY